jgi:hypothetical protein
MATIGETNPTLLDLARRLDPNDRIAVIVELLAETNEILSDMTFVEGNLPTGHKTTVRTGLPSATWRKLNYGVQGGKSKTKQVTDSCGMLEAYAEVDKALADLNGNTAAFRLSEDRAFLEAMNQEMAATLFYGDTDADPEKFNGLAPRYNATGTDKDVSTYNVIGAGGAGADNTSVWLVNWGLNTVHGIYPKGSKAGLQHEDLGEVTLFDEDGGKYQGYRTHYKWDCGLTVRDWRYVARICNIDVSDLATAGAEDDSSAALELYMIDAVNRIPNLGLGRSAFYCNRQVATALTKRAMNKKNVNLTIGEWAGRPITMFWNIPIRRCDAILNNEAAVA